MFTIENNPFGEKYTEAADKVLPLQNNVINQDNALMDYLARNLSEASMDTTATRYVPVMHSSNGQWDVAGRRVAFALSSGTEGMRNLTPVHYSPDFGNPFIYYMEYFSRRIIDSIDALIHTHDALQASKEHLQKTRYTNDDSLAAATALQRTFNAKEKELSEHVLKTMQWAGKGEVSKDARIFFDTYTATYFGESLSIEGLAWWFDVQSIKAQDEPSQIAIEIEAPLIYACM